MDFRSLVGKLLLPCRCPAAAREQRWVCRGWVCPGTRLRPEETTAAETRERPGSRSYHRPRDRTTWTERGVKGHVKYKNQFSLIQ